MKHYKNDPRQLTVKFPGTCASCGARLPKGVNAYYYPTSKRLYCLACGEADFRLFLQSGLPQDAFEGSWCYFVLRVSRHRHATRLSRMFVLPMAPLLSDQNPAIILKYT